VGSHKAYKHALARSQGFIGTYGDAMGTSRDSKPALSLLLDSLGHLKSPGAMLQALIRLISMLQQAPKAPLALIEMIWVLPVTLRLL
jgi:hypothetical protein